MKSKENDKLIIPKAESGGDNELMVRISRKANALIEEIAKKSGQPKSFVASRMIEFAFDLTEVEE